MPKIWQQLVWLSLADFFCQHCHQNMATACLAGAQSNNAAILHPGHLRMSAAYKQPATPTSNWINQLFDHGEAASDLSILACDQQFWRSGHLMRGEGGPWQLEISLVWGIHVYIPNLLFGLIHFVMFECVGSMGVPSLLPNSTVFHLDIYL